MKTDVIAVSSRDDRIVEALMQTEKVAVYKELAPKDALHLRLLTEEMMGLMRAVTGDVEGSFWIEDEKGLFEVHLKVLTGTNFLQQEQLLSASTSGRNEAHRGLMGKIRSFFEPIEGAPLLDLTPDGGYMETSWTLSAYQDKLRREARETKEAMEAWDELEKSVIAHVAEDVKVSIRGRDVEMIAYYRAG